VSGRPQNLLMLERLLDHIQDHDGVEFAYMKDVATDFARRRPRTQG
ncbi:polysaccharide deacetylase, partial [Xanthomonas citri pv. citri]|nr:polysaccharide deacetylase [Xanthomonas citri pv. citri]